MLKLDEKYINEDLIAVVKPQKGAGSRVYWQDYNLRDGNYSWRQEDTEIPPEDLATQAGLVEATKANGEWIYFNAKALLTAKPAKDGIKLKFAVDLADGSSPMGRQHITIKESLEELGVI